MTYSIDIDDYLDGLVTRRHPEVEAWLASLIKLAGLEQMQLDISNNAEVTEVKVTRSSPVEKMLKV